MMNQRKIINLFIIILASLIIATNVIAQPPFVQSSSTIGVTVDPLIYGSIKQSSDFVFHIHAYNTTSGQNLTNATTKCYFHLYNTTGNHILRQIPMSWDGQGDWETTIKKGNFSLIGSYALEPWCCIGNNICGSERLFFEVTPNGLLLDTPRAILQIGLLGLIIIIIFSIFFIGARVGESYYIAIYSALWFAFLSFFLLSWQMAENYLYDYSYLASVLYVFFLIMLVGTLPFIMILAFWHLSKLQDISKQKKLENMGYSKDEAALKLRR